MQLNNKIGILLQGRVSEWTIDIVNEYRKNFPQASILLSTWTTENIENFPCEVLQVEPPKQTYPHSSNINFQIIGTRDGLQKIDADIILKCRTDQFIHNRNIFKIFQESCPKNKIMVTDEGTTVKEDYRVSDYLQLAFKEILLNFWKTMPLYDGSYPIAPEIYFTKHYVLSVKNDNRPWKITLGEYFHTQSYDEVFKIEWEKRIKLDYYQKAYKRRFERNELF